MSFDAIRWALDQPVKAATKLVLVVMADYVNSEARDMLCWPSYKRIAEKTGHDRKTVEQAVHNLKQLHLIVDTGMKRGDTGKVVVYRLNAPISGCVTPGPQGSGQQTPTTSNNTASGVVMGSVNHPEIPANPPNSPSQSPQIPHATTPETGYGIRKEPKKRTKKETGDGITSIADVPAEVFSDWMVARKNKPVTQTALRALEREAKKAGLTLAEGVIACAELEWRGFNAGWYAERMAKTEQPRKTQPTGNKHSAAAAGIFGVSRPQGDYIDV